MHLEDWKQTDKIQSEVKIHRTTSFPAKDIGNDNDLLIMTFPVRLKKARKPQPKLRFDLEEFRGPNVACNFANNRWEIRTTLKEIIS